MPVHEIDPQTDPRWPAFVESHPRSSVFHTVEWLKALCQTYAYTPTAFTSSAPNGPLDNGIVFCRVRSWLTGSRLVSLPFSDHCEPLVQNSDALGVLLDGIRSIAGKQKYFEVRPRWMEIRDGSGFGKSAEYFLSAIELDADIETLYSNLEKNSIQRKMRRAKRENIVLDQGRSEAMLREFYELLVMTRRRHQVPPQPISWFRNLIGSFGPQLTIRIARSENKPIAGILTLRHKKTLVYKYGCSDARYHNLGGMPLVLWQMIQEAKTENLDEIDLGRTEKSNAGLVQFKENLGARGASISYWRSPRKPYSSVDQVARPGVVQKTLSQLPDSLFRLSGEVLYRHIG